MFVRILFLIYAFTCVVISLAVLVYGIAFVGGLSQLVPKTIDSGTADSLANSVMIDLALLGLFALQHSLMARQGFKQWWTRAVPPPVERSTYLLLTSLVLICLYWQWRPITNVIWDIGSPPLRLLIQMMALSGLSVVFWAQASLHPGDFLGIRQAGRHARGLPCTRAEFRIPGPYQYLRHPSMFGLLLALWATPKATAGYLLFAAVLTAYVWCAIRWEEADLIREHREAYTSYKARVPGLIPTKTQPRVWTAGR